MEDPKSSKTRLRAATCYYSSSFASLSLWKPKEMVNLGLSPDQPHSSSFSNSFHQSPLPNRHWQCLSLIKSPGLERTLHWLQKRIYANYVVICCYNMCISMLFGVLKSSVFFCKHNANLTQGKYSAKLPSTNLCKYES